MDPRRDGACGDRLAGPGQLPRERFEGAGDDAEYVPGRGPGPGNQRHELPAVGRWGRSDHPSGGSERLPPAGARPGTRNPESEP